MPIHRTCESVEKVYETADTPWDADELGALLTSNAGRGMRKFSEASASTPIWKLPKRDSDKQLYLLRQSLLYPRATAANREHLEGYAGELGRLSETGKQYGLPQIIAPLALYLAEMELPYAYTVVRHIDGGQTLDKVVETKYGKDTIRKLGATLTQYFQPSIGLYLVDISSPEQYSSNGTLYDYDPSMLAPYYSSRTFDVSGDLTELAVWYPLQGSDIL